MWCSCLAGILAVINLSRNGSLSLNHDDTASMNDPSERAVIEKSGNLRKSRRSSSENVGLGKKEKTIARVAKIAPIMNMNILLCTVLWIY